MTSSLAPQPCCRACLYELPYDTHDGLCDLCRPIVTHQRDRCAHTCPACDTDNHDTCDGQAWCDIIGVIVSCACHGTNTEPFSLAEEWAP